MKKLLIGCVVMGVLATIGVVWAHHTAETAPREDFATLEHRWLEAEAKGDTQTLQQMYGDEFLGVTFGPELVNKNDVMPFTGRPNPQWASATLENIQSRVYGNVAVVFDLIRPAGAKSAEFRMTKIYNHRYGHWQVVAAHLSKVTKEPQGMAN